MSKRKKQTPEQRERKYQHDYYQRNRDSRAESAAVKWKTDREYRTRELDRKKSKRALERSVVAEDRFKAMVEAKRKNATPTRLPRRVTIDGQEMDVYTTGALAREVGRDSGTVRKWLSDGTLPGCSVLIGGKCWFSEAFAKAVYEACRQLYYHDGRGERMVLHRLVLDQLEAAEVSYIPRGKAEADRVRLLRPRPATTA